MSISQIERLVRYSKFFLSLCLMSLRSLLQEAPRLQKTLFYVTMCYFFFNLRKVQNPSKCLIYAFFQLYTIFYSVVTGCHMCLCMSQTTSHTHTHTHVYNRTVALARNTMVPLVAWLQAGFASVSWCQFWASGKGISWFGSIQEWVYPGYHYISIGINQKKAHWIPLFNHLVLIYTVF